jgi:hypothetical protein
MRNDTKYKVIIYYADLVLACSRGIIYITLALLMIISFMYREMHVSKAGSPTIVNPSSGVLLALIVVAFIISFLTSAIIVISAVSKDYINNYGIDWLVYIGMIFSLGSIIVLIDLSLSLHINMYEMYPRLFLTATILTLIIVDVIRCAYKLAYSLRRRLQ